METERQRRACLTMREDILFHRMALRRRRLRSDLIHCLLCNVRCHRRHHFFGVSSWVDGVLDSACDCIQIQHRRRKKNKHSYRCRDNDTVNLFEMREIKRRWK